MTAVPLVAAPHPHWADAVQRLQSASQAPWAHTLRHRGAQQAGALNWPHARLEAWKLTPVSALSQRAFGVPQGAQDAAAAFEPAAAALAETLQGPRLVFIDGLWASRLSQKADVAGVRIEPLACHTDDPASLARRFLGGMQLGEKHFFAALSDALWQDGAVVHVAASAALQAPIELVFLHTDAGVMKHPRVVIVAEAQSQVSVVERHESVAEVGGAAQPHFTHAITEIFVGPGAQVTHTLLQAQSSAYATHFSTLAARLDRDAQLKAAALAMGGVVARQEMQVSLEGPGAGCELAGIYLGRGKQHQEMVVQIAHRAPQCHSSQLFKGIFDDQATGAFAGKIHVAPGADKTDARQLNKNLLLSSRAAAYTKPHLEILTDDVKCSHGATVGQLSEEAQFYLRSRGLDASAAQQLLTYAFASDALGAVSHAGLRAYADGRLRQWLGFAGLGGAP